MLWVKAFHILFVVSWFAGLFYLPRIFVNLAMVPPDSVAERERLLLMAGKLFRFMTPLGVLAIALGLITGSTFATLAAVLCIIPSHLIFIKYFEEKELELRFGESYLEYKKTVPFLIPKFGS